MRLKCTLFKENNILAIEAKVIFRFEEGYRLRASWAAGHDIPRDDHVTSCPLSRDLLQPLDPLCLVLE